MRRSRTWAPRRSCCYRPTGSGEARSGVSSRGRSSPSCALLAGPRRRTPSSRRIRHRPPTWSGAWSGSSDCSRWLCGASPVKSSEARHLILVKHAMPQVDVETPAHQWRLRPEGVDGANAVADRLRSAHYRPTKVVASLEPKATETGSIIAKRLRLPFATVEGLHEHDRRTAGFLKADVFAARMRDLFEHP